MELGRRSSRAKTTPSSSSVSSSNSRGALSIEDKEKDAMTNVSDDAIHTRRKRGQGDQSQKEPHKEKEREKSVKEIAPPIEMVTTGDDDEGGEDDGVVRCLCGLEDYPGPPIYDEDTKEGIKEGIEEPFITVADVTEDLAGFFVQCDVCKVWQHGGCVGIQSEEQSPDEYFCEKCRKELHKIFTAPNGQNYSHYIPLFQSLSRTTSRAASFSKDGTRSPRGSKSGRPSSSAQSAKRRSTMNSRDAAYDEEEQLRRAIEASKGGVSGESTDGGTRRGKRGRSDSEEKPEGPKRQRTASASPSPSREPRRIISQAESDDGTLARPTGAKKIRGAAARNHREKELRDEKERLRLEAKKKREGRAERRRGDDSDIGDDLPPELSSHNRSPEPQAPPEPPASSQNVAPDTPPLASAPPVSHKKGGRPPNARKGKLGKNQYTKDRDIQERGQKSPGRSPSRDVTKPDDGHPPASKSANEGKSTKPRSAHNKVTMTDLKRRVGVMLEFISRTQVEMATGAMSGINEEETESMMRGIANSLPMIQVNGGGAEKQQGDAGTEVKEFNDMTALEMMDVLTTQLVKWQKEFV